MSTTLSWDAASDNVGILAYDIYKDGNLIGSSATTDYTVSGLTAETSYDFYVIARDAAGNISTNSNTISVTTITGPNYLIYQDFNDCTLVADSFVAYNEASDKDWTCLTQYGFDNTGCYQVNGYLENVASKDWLITTNPINFAVHADESLSVFLKYAYGTTPLELVYSTDYNGTGNPSSFTWLAVPNVAINTPTGSSGDTIQEITNADISSISQSAYLAFKYYSNGSPTRWNVDNFSITTSNNVGVENKALLATVSVYPNPTSGNITVKSEEKIKRICISNLLGQEILCVNPKANQTQINLATLEAGSYFITVNLSDSSKTYKVIKQ